MFGIKDNSQLDVLLQTSTKLNCVKSSQSLRGITAAENEYIDFVNSQNQLLMARVKELEDDIVVFKKMLSEQEESSRESVQELKSAVDSERKRLDGFATTYQQQMQTDQTNFSAMSDSLKTSFSEAQSERKELFSKQAKGFEEEATELINEYQKRFDEYEQQVVNIVGVVNTNMFSYKYKEVADDAHKRARFWHVLYGLMGLGQIQRNSVSLLHGAPSGIHDIDTTVFIISCDHQNRHREDTLGYVKFCRHDD